MPAPLVPDKDVPALAARIDSPAMLAMLRYLRNAGFIRNGPEVNEEMVAILNRLVALGLVDPASAGTAEGPPVLWAGNANGSRVLRYFEALPLHEQAEIEAKVPIHPRARPGLAALSEMDRLAVLSAVEALRARDPASWPKGEAIPLADKSLYLLRVTPSLRAFIAVLDSGDVELSDIVREETLRLFLERQRAAGAH